MPFRRTIPGITLTTEARTKAGSERARIGVLFATNLFGGLGVASGVTVGALLVEELGATSLAGLGQSVSVLGAAVAAIPLATLAARRGRKWSLGVGYLVAAIGATIILAAAVTSSLLLLLSGLALFGVAQATGLQSRYAAADGVDDHARGRTIAIVVWATTVGSVAGPNLTAAGVDIGSHLGVGTLAGPYLFSAGAFLVSAVLFAAFYRARRIGPTPVTVVSKSTVGAVDALRWAASRPPARFAVTLLATAHAVMVMVMVMTPLHMRHSGMSLEVVGIVISVHIVGMYFASPLFGWAVDRYGARRIAACGIALQTVAVVVGFVSAQIGGYEALTATALLILGLGWSAATIAASAMIAATPDDQVRIPLQGAADAGMNYAAAIAAAIAGPILTIGGFQGVNVAAAVLLAPTVYALARSRRSRPT